MNHGIRREAKAAQFVEGVSSPVLECDGCKSGYAHRVLSICSNMMPQINSGMKDGVVHVEAWHESSPGIVVEQVVHNSSSAVIMVQVIGFNRFWVQEMFGSSNGFNSFFRRRFWVSTSIFQNRSCVVVPVDH